MDSLFPDNVADSLEHFSEQQEIELSRIVNSAVAMPGGLEAIRNFTLTYILKNEAELREKYPADDVIFDGLEEYREQVRAGLRKPLPGTE